MGLRACGPLGSGSPGSGSPGLRPGMSFLGHGSTGLRASRPPQSGSPGLRLGLGFLGARVYGSPGLQASGVRVSRPAARFGFPRGTG
eukprot:5394871-Pyramimonas_sp.AAC.1